MLSTFISQVSGFFSQRFWVAYWGPVFVTLGLAAILGIGLIGPKAAFDRLPKDTTQQLFVGLAALLAITLFAYLLQTLTVFLVRLYEGYWPQIWPISLLANRLIEHQQQVLERIKDKLQHDPTQVGRYHAFPRDTDLLKPTRLGNVLAAAEEHPLELYQLNASMWWPRLVSLLPDTFRAQMDAALTPLLVWLNMSSLFVALALGGGVAVLVIERNGWLALLIAFAATLIGGLALALLCYLVALQSAAEYGELVRAAFELYRLEILKQMHIPVPESFVEERRLWAALNEWLYYPVMPWAAGGKTGTQLLNYPFMYDKG